MFSAWEYWPRVSQRSWAEPGSCAVSELFRPQKRNPNKFASKKVINPTEQLFGKHVCPLFCSCHEHVRSLFIRNVMRLYWMPVFWYGVTHEWVVWRCASVPMCAGAHNLPGTCVCVCVKCAEMCDRYQGHADHTPCAVQDNWFYHGDYQSRCSPNMCDHDSGANCIRSARTVIRDLWSRQTRGSCVGSHLGQRIRHVRA